MADSEHLKDLKSIWGNSCHSMWVEILCVNITGNRVVGDYSNIPKTKSIDELFHSPETNGKINALTKDHFLTNLQFYKQAIISNRIVILSASFEAYFENFLDAYISRREKLYDATSSKRTKDGDKLFGEISKTRGLSQRVEKFSEESGAGIRPIQSILPYLSDVYALRNILAHRAGIVDDFAASQLTHIALASGDKVVLTPNQLMELAAPVVRIAEFLDRKIVSEYDNTTGRPRPVAR